MRSTQCGVQVIQRWMLAQFRKQLVRGGFDDASRPGTRTEALDRFMIGLAQGRSSQTLQARTPPYKWCTVTCRQSICERITMSNIRSTASHENKLGRTDDNGSITAQAFFHSVTRLIGHWQRYRRNSFDSILRTGNEVKQKSGLASHNASGQLYHGYDEDTFT